MTIIEKCIRFFVCILGVLVGIVLGGTIEQNRTESHFGYAVDQGELFKEQCEANLPRNVHCSTVVQYVPDNESEQ